MPTALLLDNVSATNMKIAKLILAVSTIALISGCASHSGTAALAGGVIGYAIANEMNRPPAPAVVVVPPPRQVQCYTKYIGYDQYGRAVYKQVCR